MAGERARCYRSLEHTAPWRLVRSDPAAAAAALYAPLEAARIAAAELSPFVPGVARTIAARLGEAAGPAGAAWCPARRWRSVRRRYRAARRERGLAGAGFAGFVGLAGFAGFVIGAGAGASVASLGTPALRAASAARRITQPSR